METAPFKNMLSALLEMSGGLLGRVEPSLRAVAVDLDHEQELYICYFYYDGLIDEYKRDLVSCAATEASGNWVTAEHYIQLDYPAPIPVNGMLAYLRKEPEFYPPIIQLLPRGPKTLSESYLAYALQEGLLGRIIPSLRYTLISIDDNEKKMNFYFYYDEKITAEVLALSKEAVDIAKTAFPPDYTSTETIEFVPFPESFPEGGTRSVYRRNEHQYD